MLTRELNFHGLSWAWLWVLCIGAAAALIVVLYRYERRLVGGRVGHVLLALRMAALLTLFVMLLEPVIGWAWNREQSGRIVVAVDVSESMQTVDQQANDGEKLRWARALEMIGNEATKDRLDRWQAAFDAGKQPQWVDADETADPERRAALEQSRRDGLQDVFNSLDDVSRLQMADRLLRSTTVPLIANLREQGRVELVAFAGLSESTDEKSLPRLLESPTASLQVDRSNLSAALAAASIGNDSSPVLGVIVFSDGRDNASGDLIAAARRLGELSTPVFPIVLGSGRKPKDIAIASLDHPQTVFLNDSPVLIVTLSTPGFDGTELSVVLAQEGAEPISRVITPQGPVTELEFRLDASEVGRRNYRIETAVQPDETRDDNNSSEFSMTVVDDKSHVLLLEGEARWEFRFIDNALRRDERIEVKQVVFQQPFLRILQDTSFSRRLEPAVDPEQDLSRSPFAEPDMVIVGDVDPQDLSEDAWELLEKFVAEGGGTLVLLAGKNHFPLAYQSDVLSRLLPMTNLRPISISDASAKAPPAERGFHMRLTPEGKNESMLQFDADPVANQTIWADLPGHTWGLFGTAKPGATVLATIARPGGNNALQAERRNALIVRQQFGFGQVLWLGIDSTWRWRHRVGDQHHHRFWGQLARWAASNKAVAGNEFVKFGPDRTDVSEGENIMLRARFNQQFHERFPRLEAKVYLHRVTDGVEEKPLSTLPLAPSAGRPLVREGRLASLPPGEYLAKLIVENADVGPTEISAPIYVHGQQTVELADVSANPELLQQIATESGGRLFHPDEVSQLPALLQPREHTDELREETTLWDHWLMLAVFCAFVTTEWAVRKLNGLP